MKKYLVLILLVFCAVSVFAQNSVSLDDGIEDTANFLNERIPAGTSVAVFNFASDSKRLSEYIIDELTIALANVGMDVFDRNNLDEVNREIYYGFSGAVSDDSAQSYGQGIGVQTVILGSMTKSNENTYRLRVQAIIVETKRIQAGRTININSDEQLLALLDIKIQMEHRFTSLEKIGFGFKNMLFGGMGSFQMNDKLGGGITIGFEIVSIGVLIYGFLVDDRVIFYEGTGYWANGKREYEEYKASREKAIGIIAGGAGGLVLAWTWGFIRPFMYDKPVAVQKVASLLDHLNVGLMPMSSGDAKVTVSLSYSF